MEIRGLRKLIKTIKNIIIILFFIDNVKLPKSINKIHNESKFDHEQLREIKKGIIQNVNITEYAKHYFTALQMKQIRLALLQGVNVSLLNNRYFSHERMKTIRIIIALKERIK